MGIGNTRLDELAHRMANLKKIQNQLWLKAANVAEVRKLIIKLNTEFQLGRFNIDSKGNKLSDIGGDYSDVTIFLSEKKGRPKLAKDRIDLHDTGKFWETFVVNITSKQIEIYADTIKDGEDLRYDWGPNIIGLTDESLDIVAKKILENFKKEVRLALGL